MVRPCFHTLVHIGVDRWQDLVPRTPQGGAAQRLVVHQLIESCDVFPLKLPSPLYAAIIECDPIASEERLNVACPPISVPTASAVAPS